MFEPQGGYIESLKTGKRTKLTKKGMTYHLEVWMKARDKEDEIMEVDQAEGSFSWQGIP